MDKGWSLSNLPPQGHPDVGRWFWDNCYLVSEAEKERLELKTRWKENHRIWRGGATEKNKQNKHAVTCNLIFSNIQRTVANLTAKNPKAEATSVDGAYQIDAATGQPLLDGEGNPIPDETASDLTVWLETWWGDTEQINLLVDSALNMEIYGPAIEKAVYSKENMCDVVALDPFQLIIAPGNWETPNHAPYVGTQVAMRPDEVEAKYGLEPGTVDPDEVYSLLGEDREDNRPLVKQFPFGAQSASKNYGGKTVYNAQEATTGEDRALVVELWVRDLTTEPMADEAGQPVLRPDGTPQTQLIYPGGIRVISLTNKGSYVISDMPNPNVNPAISREQQSNTYLYDHFPYSMAVSYRDPSSIWGFAAAEQVGDMAEKIAELLSRMFAYLARVMKPTLILPQDTGLDERDVTNEPGLILKPGSGEAGNGIRYLQTPNLPSDTIQLYNMLLGMFDRVYQIEDADRGDTPNRIIAASAIVALQERNQVLMRHKIRQVDYLIRQRGRCAISFFQNFGIVAQSIKVDDDVKTIRGNDLINRKFQFMVESGSTITKTTLQIQEQAMDLAEKGHIDSQALLDALDWPGRDRIIERMAENGGNLDKAAQIFMQAGVPAEMVQELLSYAQQPQGAPAQ